MCPLRFSPHEDADTMTRRLNAASQLIEGLASERKRWTEDLQKMGEVKKRSLDVFTSYFMLFFTSRSCDQADSRRFR